MTQTQAGVAGVCCLQDLDFLQVQIQRQWLIFKLMQPPSTNKSHTYSFDLKLNEVWKVGDESRGARAGQPITAGRCG